MGNRVIIVGFFGIIAIAILIAVCIIVYKLIYNMKINKQLQSGSNEGKQWPAPGKVLLAVFIVCIVIFCISLLIDSYNYDRQTWTYNVNQYTDYISLTAEEIKESAYAQYVDAYEKGELKGYDKVEKTENNFHYIYFVSKDDYDILHPSFVLFVEYVGNGEFVGYNEDMRIYTSENTSWGSSSRGEISDYYCVIGNMDFSQMYTFNYTLSLYDDFEKMQKDETNVENIMQEEAESISILIN